MVLKLKGSFSCNLIRTNDIGAVVTGKEDDEGVGRMKALRCVPCRLYRRGEKWALSPREGCSVNGMAILLSQEFDKIFEGRDPEYS